MTSKNKGFYDCNRLGDILFIFHKNHKTYLNNELARYDLNLIHALCIERIHLNHDINQKDLADDLYLTKGAITKAIKKLESNGYILREKSSKDSRANILKLTQKGLDIIPVIKKINFDWESEMGFDNLTSEFFKTFQELASKSAKLNK
ncbi:MAG: MarR family transcriptional regulator [Methanobrevibacter sp.]|nr:MarR family transcriptional regulator [Methanobrevibacter sp.]